MTEAISDERKKEIFRTMAKAWHEQDWDTCCGLFAPDGILHSVMLAPVVGRDTIHSRLLKLSGANKKVTLVIERMGVVDGALMVQRVDEVIIDGVRGECPAIGVLEFTGDKIARWRDYYDRATLVKAAGYRPEQERH